MHKNSLTEISLAEIDNVTGGVLDHKKILKGAISAGVMKTCAHLIEVWMPEGKKNTFLGETWNGLVKGVAGFLSNVAVGVGAAYIVIADREQAGGNNPHHD